MWRAHTGSGELPWSVLRLLVDLDEILDAGAVYVRSGMRSSHIGENQGVQLNDLVATQLLKIPSFPTSFIIVPSKRIQPTMEEPVAFIGKDSPRPDWITP